MSVLLLGFNKDKFHDEQEAAIREAAGGLEPVYSKDKADIEARLNDVEAAVGSFSRDLMARASNLKWYQQWGAGADWLLEHPELAQKDFTLTNVSGIHEIPIGEQIMTYLLMFARSFPQIMRAQLASSWSQEESKTFELAGKTMLLLGTGAIGAYTAKLAEAFGVKVVGVRRNPEKQVEHIAEMVALGDLSAALPDADFVVLTLPLTEDTRHIIGEAELERMKSTAILVNIGRGGLVDEPALVRALQEGKLAGVGLDVFETEPLPETSPLWELENVILTPHMAGDTPHYDERALEVFLNNLRRFAAGEPLTHVVDKQAGY